MKDMKITLNRIIHDLQRMKRNNEEFVKGFVRFATTNIIPYDDAYISWDVDKERFLFHVLADNVHTVTLKEYTTMAKTPPRICVRDMVALYYPSKSNEIVLGSAKELRTMHLNLKTSIYSASKKYRIINEAGARTYKWYEEIIEAELDYYLELKKRSEKTTDLF